MPSASSRSSTTSRRSGTARVARPARLLILYKTDFDALIDGEAKIAVVVMRNLSRVLASYARRNPVVLTEPGPGRRAPSRGEAVWLVARSPASVVLAWLARGLVLPVFLAMVFAYLLSPLVAWTDALAIRRSVAVGALFATQHPRAARRRAPGGAAHGARRPPRWWRACPPLVDPDRHRPRRRARASWSRRRPSSAACSPRARLDPPADRRPSTPRIPSEFFQHVGAPLPARDPRPLLRLLPAPGPAVRS